MLQRREDRMSRIVGSLSLRTSCGRRRISGHGKAGHPFRTASNRTLCVPRRAGARPLRAAGDVRARGQDPARRASRAPGLCAQGGRDRGRTNRRFLRISLPPRHHLAHLALRRRHAPGSWRTLRRLSADRPRHPRMGPWDGPPRAAARLRLHRRIPARGSGAARRPHGEHALVARRRAGPPLPEGPRGGGSHLGARRQRLHFRRSERRDGPGPGAHRGGPGRRGGAGRRAGDGHVRAPARRSEPIQRAAPTPGREHALASRSRRLGRRASGERSLRPRPGAPGGKEPATPHPRLPQRAGDRTCRGDRTAPPGGRPPCPAAIGGQPRRGRRALRVRQRRGAAPRLPSSPARDPVRLPRPLLVPRGAGLMKGRIHPAFVVAGAVFVVLLCAAAVRATPSILIVPLEREFGWRRALPILVAIVIALLLPLVALLVRDRPADLGLLPYGASPDTPPLVPSRQHPVGNALRVLRESALKRDFWLLAGSFFVCGASTNGLVGTHLVPACMDHGIPEVRAAGLLAVMGIFDLIGTTASGWLSDRFDSRKLLCCYYGFRGLSLLWLPQAFDAQVLGLPVFAVFYGLDWIATVPPTVRLATEAVGVQDAPIAFGWVVASHQVGAGVGALGAGLIRSTLATYTPAWVAAGTICLVAAIAVLRIGRRAPGVGLAAIAAPQP